ncbi:MAG: ABC transporter ATP-binding protein [Deltaproteobacteria bacterium]|nr:ABC transporter ATP-binding protein [Deltaproteobacteria bacterium]
MTAVIEATGLVKNYGRTTALDGVDMRVAAGEIVGFLGPNGAGKSTFVKILLNLLQPTSGSVTLFGHCVSSASSRKHIGFLPENIRAYPFLTVEEFMRFHAELAHIASGEIAAEIERCLAMVGMARKRKVRMRALSKGMLQRVGMGQALLGRPRLLILDEPASGLDPIGIKDMRTILLDQKKEGTAVFFNSHLLSEVERTCDRVAILHKGKIVKSGTRDDLSGRQQHLEIHADGFTEQMAAEINRICSRPLESEGNRLVLYPGSAVDVLSIHRIIADNGGHLLSLAWQGDSLEELFYRLIKDDHVDNS